MLIPDFYIYDNKNRNNKNKNNSSSNNNKVALRWLGGAVVRASDL